MTASATEPAGDGPPDTHFVVERMNWRRADGGVFHRLPGTTRVASFDIADAADSYRRELERKAHEVLNPFLGTLGAPVEQTTLPEPVFCDWLVDHNIEPPAPDRESGRRDWAKWWAATSPGWSTDDRAAIWSILNKVPIYRVSERPRRPTAFAVVRVIWGYNDEWFYPGAEGGETQTLYRSRERAEAVSREQEREARAEWAEMFRNGGGYEPAGDNQFELKGRTLPGRDPFGPPPAPACAGETDAEGDDYWTFAADEVPFFEVVEVELEGLA